MALLSPIPPQAMGLSTAGRDSKGRMKHKTWGDTLGSTGSKQDLRRKAKAHRGSAKRKGDRRGKIAHTAFICAASFACGLVSSQRGPSVLDLGYLASADLQQASSLFALGAGGHLGGCLITGVAFDQFQTPLLLFWSLVFLGASTASLPWCGSYGAMAAVYFLSLSCVGCVEAGSYAYVARRWKNKGGRVIQLLQLCFVAGAVVSPVVTHFFLTPIAEINEALASTNGEAGKYYYYYNTTTTTTTSRNDSRYNHHPWLYGGGGEDPGGSQSAATNDGRHRYAYNESLHPSDGADDRLLSIHHRPRPLNLSDADDSIGVMYRNASGDAGAQAKSRICYAYGIAGAVALLAALPFVIIVLMNKRRSALRKKKKKDSGAGGEGGEAGGSSSRRSTTTRDDERSKREREDRRRGRGRVTGSSALALLLLFVLFFAVSAVEESFHQFLFTFLTQAARWSAGMSALITSWFWAGVILVRLASYLSPNRVPHAFTLAASFLALPVALAGLHVSVSGFPGSGSSSSPSSLADQSIDGVWASVFFVGMSSSLVFPVSFTWLHSSAIVGKTGSGVMSGVVMVAFALAGVCNPVFLGPLFQRGTARVGFPTLLIVEALVAGAAFVLLHVLTGRMEAKDRRALATRNVLEKFIEKTSATPDTDGEEEEEEVTAVAGQSQPETDIEKANDDDDDS